MNFKPTNSHKSSLHQPPSNKQFDSISYHSNHSHQLSSIQLNIPKIQNSSYSSASNSKPSTYHLPKFINNPSINKKISEKKPNYLQQKKYQTQQPHNRTENYLQDSNQNNMLPHLFRQTSKKSIINLIKGTHKNQTLPQQQTMKLSKIGSTIKLKMQSLKNLIICQICEQTFKKSQTTFLTQCEHKYSYCQSCLQHYTIYKVKQFEEVTCPHQGCTAVMDTNQSFYKMLPAQIQKYYAKIHQFYQLSGHSNAKMCPQPDCQGFILLQIQTKMTCNTCFTQFCSKCLFKIHEGDCQQHELQFFQKNLKYRQCKQCKTIIQRNEGCNHMTCKCNFQFCYVCGHNWTPPHYGEHDQNGNLIIVKEPVIQPHCFCQILLCIGGSLIGSLLVLLWQIFRGICLIILILCWYTLKNVMGPLFLLAFTIVVGIFGYSIQLICQQQSTVMLMLSIIFFPIAAIVGIKQAFEQIFCDSIGQICRQNSHCLNQLSECLCN